MELTGDSLIAADRTRVWAALNDPAVLARCSAGVESLAAVAPTEADPPNRCVLAGAGDGEGTGFAAGRAEVTLTDAVVDDRPGTRLCYVVTSAGVASPQPIAAAARGDAEAFFLRLKAEVETAVDTPGGATNHASAEPVAVARAAATDAQQLHGNRRATGLTPLVWSTVIVLIVLVVLVWQLR